MEDGRVDWAPGNILYLSQDYKLIDTYGPIDRIENIVSLSYESDYEGSGGMTVLARDTNGIIYDLKIAHEFSFLTSDYEPWVADLYTYGPGFMAVLDLYDDGSLYYQIGYIDSGISHEYIGTYEVSIALNGDLNPGTIIFDMYKDPNSTMVYDQEEIKAIYYATVSLDDLTLTLSHSKGDYLHEGEDRDMSFLFFEYGFSNIYSNTKDFDFLETDEDYAYYLTSHVSEAREMVEEYGMAILFEDENFGYDEGLFYIWLGTNHPGKFTREILYVIDGFGDIFKYDPLEDDWILVYEN